jgi:hypothetical protein
MFEPTGIARVVAISDAAGQVRRREPAASQTSRRGPDTDGPGRNHPSGSPAGHGAVVTADQIVTAAPDNARSPNVVTAAPPKAPMTPVPGQRADVPAAGARIGQAGDEAAPTVPARDVAPRREDQRAKTTLSADVAASGDASGGPDERPNGTSVVLPNPTPAEQSPVDRWPVEPSAVEHGGPSRHTVPVGERSRGLAPTVPPVADPGSLPRLHVVRTAEPAAAKPEITVTIGRIEVLQPAPEPPAPRPAPPGKGATAPDLAEYLRDRSGR